MKPEHIKRLITQSRASIAIIAAGFLLLIYMITVEDEPGAVPLFFIVTGTAWFAITRSRLRRMGNNG